MQALEFESVGVAAEHFRDVRDGVRVVRGELRIDAFAGALQQPRAGEVGNVGVGLAREHRVTREAALLRALDLAVPVRALDQAQRDAPVGFAQALHQPLERGVGALLVGLHGEPEARVAARHVAFEQPVDQQQRQLEAFGLLGVERDADAGIARLPHERLDDGIELGHHARGLRELVARMQRRQLDGDAVARGDRLARLDRLARRPQSPPHISRDIARHPRA